MIRGRRSIRFRLALRTCAAPPWGVRVVDLTKSRKIPTRKTSSLFFTPGLRSEHTPLTPPSTNDPFPMLPQMAYVKGPPNIDGVNVAIPNGAERFTPAPNTHVFLDTSVHAPRTKPGRPLAPHGVARPASTRPGTPTMARCDLVARRGVACALNGGQPS